LTFGMNAIHTAGMALPFSDDVEPVLKVGQHVTGRFRPERPCAQWRGWVPKGRITHTGFEGFCESEVRHRRPAQRGQIHPFNALTKAGIAAENYPFCTIEPNVGVVGVADTAGPAVHNRRPERIVPALASLWTSLACRRRQHRRSLGNQFLAHIRENATINVGALF
jgi:hypothetical protein